MVEETKRYGKHKILIDREEPRLVVDEVEIDVTENDGAYLTGRLPYEEFLSLEGIAKRLIDNEPEVA